MNRVQVGKKLAELRGKRKREEVAAAIGVSVSTIAMYELGERTPRDEIKEALANYFGVTVHELFFNPDAHFK